MKLPKMTEYAHHILELVIREGDRVIDATMGNGHDTLFLAEIVGKTGKVYGFDIQESAIQNTRERLEQNDQMDQVVLLHDSHALMKEYVQEPVQAILFNLGYLPGGDKQVTTQIESTFPAIQASLDLLRIGGVLVLVIYPGHPAGRIEADRIDSWAKVLDEKKYVVQRIEYYNQEYNPPYILVIQKRAH